MNDRNTNPSQAADTDIASRFAQLQAEDQRNEWRLMWVEVLVLVVLVSAALGLMLALSP